MRPDQLPSTVRGSDPTRPVLTYYDDATGERIELSARVLSMWVAKAAHWLTDEMLLDPRGRLLIAMPSPHWRSIYWALAGWTVAGHVKTSGDADVVVAVDGEGDLVEPAGSLAPSDITAFPDDFGAIVQGATHDLALDAITYGDLLHDLPAPSRVMLVDTELATSLRETARTLAAGGSVVLVRNEIADRRPARLADEGVDMVIDAAG